VWEYSNGKSGYGTLQQSGNVWELCADWYEADYYGKSPTKDPGGPYSGTGRVYRGGGFNVDAASSFRGADRSGGSDPASRGGTTGFRLVRNSP